MVPQNPADDQSKSTSARFTWRDSLTITGLVMNVLRILLDWHHH